MSRWNNRPRNIPRRQRLRRRGSQSTRDNLRSAAQGPPPRRSRPRSRSARRTSPPSSNCWKSSVRKRWRGASQTKRSPTSKPSSCREKRPMCSTSAWPSSRRNSENEKALEQLRTERESPLRRSEAARDIAGQKNWRWAGAPRPRDALIDKAREAELAEISRNLARERAETRQGYPIWLPGARTGRRPRRASDRGGRGRERARDQRHEASEETALSVRVEP